MSINYISLNTIFLITALNMVFIPNEVEILPCLKLFFMFA